MMKPRHAAALALVGWYLMTPPNTGYDPPRSRDDGAPLSKWFFYNELRNDIHNRNDRTQAMKFKTAEECEVKKEEKWPSHPPPIPSTVGGDMKRRVNRWREAGAKSRCVASDDPRLKSN
jgi:hypothetical protein